MNILIRTSRPVILSTLWIALMLNYIYCDVLGLNDPAHLGELRAGTFAGAPFDPMQLVAAGALMQVPIAMVLISRLVRRAPSRWVNIVASALLAATQLITLFVGTPPTPVYVFFSVVEIAIIIVIIVVAATWTRSAEAARPAGEVVA
jgi:hypothetical protein